MVVAFCLAATSAAAPSQVMVTCVTLTIGARVVSIRCASSLVDRCGSEISVPVSGAGARVRR
ncbi:hypothetical protein CCR96_23485 [Halochromatium roseum]|nr:hypothetical protein [Halochromatium roseum]